MRPILPTFVFPAAMLAAMAHAEPPMHVDDAGTLAGGGMKIEGAFMRDDETRGKELVLGWAPIENLELGVALSREHDRSATPATRLTSSGVALKWVPMQNDTGWALGLRLDVGRTRVHDRAAAERSTERETALTALASYRWVEGKVLHANLGASRVQAQGDCDTAATWGVGYEHPLAAALKLTVEVFGEEGTRPDKALGLRYELFQGFKVSAAIGRGNDRSFGQVGFAWEF